MNLLQVCDEAIVKKTTQTRKLTLDGQTKVYPVYQIRLDMLYYNDQNDRIATWISQYNNESGNLPIATLSREEYNKVIENFIIESNPAAIEKTKNNISMVNQREAGVILTDGRVIDGNRRFTCLRMLNRENASFNYFETVILESSLEENKKQIKMLELAIQHGEEQRVDYNLIDLAIGAYRDIVQTKLLTIDEYAGSTNESIAEVKKRLEVAQLIAEFLEYMGVAEQYHVAREMQVFSVFYEMVPLLKRCENEDSKKQLKQSVFNNLMFGSILDHRKYIRDVKSLMDNGFYGAYMRDQDKIAEEIQEIRDEQPTSSFQEIKTLVSSNKDVSEDMQASLDKFLNKSKRKQVKEKPTQIVTKSISLLRDVDTRIFEKLDDDEKEKLKDNLGRLTKAAGIIMSEIDPLGEFVKEEAQKKVLVSDPRVHIGHRHMDEPMLIVTSRPEITNLFFNVDMIARKYLPGQLDTVSIVAYFVNDKYEAISNVENIRLAVDEPTKIRFSLNANASTLEKCSLIIRSCQDGEDEAQQLIDYNVNIAFVSDFDF